MKVIFDTLAELLSSVNSAGDDRSALIVKYRGKDYFTLAVDEDSALAAVAREMKFEVGNVPLDLIVAAIKGGPSPPTAKDNPEVTPRWALESLAVNEVKAIGASLDIESRGLSKATLIEKIREKDASFREPTA